MGSAICRNLFLTEKETMTKGDKGNCFSHILFRIVNIIIVNMAYRHCCCPITYIFHVWNHVWLFLPRGHGGPAQREQPPAAVQYIPHAERGLVLEPWAKSTVPLALSDGGGKGGGWVEGMRREIRSLDGAFTAYDFCWFTFVLLWACMTP